MKGGLTLFTDYYKDKIKWGSGTTQNLSSAFYCGLDFNFEAELFQGFWSLALNGEYLYNRLLDKSSEYTYGKRIMWTPDLVCNLTTALHFEKADISLTATYTGRRYTDNMNLYYLPPYVLINLSAQGSPIHEKIVPYIKADNLLNWQYQSVEGYAMPGVSLTIGCKYDILYDPVSYMY
jgi:outer membrane cobalamin receptor